MSLFGKFGKAAVKPAWTFAANGILWRLLPAGDHFFVGEDRDKESKSVSFFCIDCTTGAVQWKDVRQGEQWWTGIEAVDGKFVFLHEYSTPDMPGHKKIHCLDLASGKLLWSNVDLQFVLAANGILIAAREGFETREFFEIDVSNGNVLAKIEVGRVHEERARAPQPSRGLRFPVPIDLAAPGSQLQPLLARRKSGEGEVQYAETFEGDHLHIMAAYVLATRGAEGQTYSQHLEIFERESLKSLFRETINRETVAIVPDAFFLLGEMMYYIQERKTLCAIDLGAVGRES
jgi:hypothetical protein